MKLVFLVGVLAVAVFLAVATPARAVSWPAQCHSMRCVNAHLNRLDQRQQALASRTQTLERTVAAQAAKLSCLSGVRSWELYGYDASGNFFTYLDVNRDYGAGVYNGPFFLLTDTCGAF